MTGAETYATAQADVAADSVSPAKAGARFQILKAALRLVTQDRERDHGDARAQWCEIAALWSIHAEADITPAMALRMMSMMKAVRAKSSPGNTDNAEDACGYDALAGEADRQGWAWLHPADAK